MKKYVLFILSVLFFAALVSTKTITKTDPQDPKKVSHIRMVSLKDGKKTVIDTIITGKNVKVISHTGDKNFEWVTMEDGKNLDSLKEISGVRHKGGKGSTIVITKHGGGNGPMLIRHLDADGDSIKGMMSHMEITGRGTRRHEIIREIETEGDSGKEVTVVVEGRNPGRGDAMRFNGRPGRGRRMIMTPFAPGVPAVPGTPAFRLRHQGGNVINLSDPGVLSFKKKKMSGGREKITIIRNEVSEETETFNIRTEAEEDVVKDINVPRVVRGYEIRKAPAREKVDIEVVKEPVRK